MFPIFSLKDGVSNVKGFFCDGVSVGMKPNGGLDVGFIRSETPCDIPATFPQIDFKAIPQLNTYPKGVIPKKDF